MTQKVYRGAFITFCLTDLFVMCMSVLLSCMQTTCMSSAYKGQEIAFPGTDLHTFGCEPPCGAGNETQVFFKSRECS